VRPIVADTGGLLRALARTPDGRSTWPEYQAALTEASAVIVPAMVLPEVDYFLRGDRSAMRKLIVEILDPRTRYELEPATAIDLARAMEFDARFADIRLGLVDGVVAAVAERRRVLRILTTDRRDFSAVRIGRRFERALIPIP
jgi:predicted nucleic acid-binding protein